MDESYLKEKANCIRNEMNHLWTGMFITGGGGLGFMVFENKTIWTNTLSALGIFFMILFLNAYINRRTELLQYLNKLKKEGLR